MATIRKLKRCVGGAARSLPPGRAAIAQWPSTGIVNKDEFFRELQRQAKTLPGTAGKSLDNEIRRAKALIALRTATMFARESRNKLRVVPRGFPATY